MKNLNASILFLILYLFSNIKFAEASATGSEPGTEPGAAEKLVYIGEDPNQPVPDDFCLQTQPTKDIEDDCIEGNKLTTGKTCCYMTIEFKEGTQYSCIPLNKDINEIENKIKEIEEKYKDNYKKAKIICSFKFIQINIISLYLLFLFLL